MLQTYRIEAVQIKFQGYSLLLMYEFIYRVLQIHARIDRIMSRQIKSLMQCDAARILKTVVKDYCKKKLDVFIEKQVPCRQI